ncbi:hypothetical protein [Pelobacter propionicus]|uniref:hypothetical protein n=1 Tax=Pelobacter propionicus TaxID=29543 RepID=UPI0005A27945|nr:hypothetical protein [Pelobacter propionicus]
MKIRLTVLEFLTRAATDLEAAYILASKSTGEKEKIGKVAKAAYALVSESAGEKSSEDFSQ